MKIFIDSADISEIKKYRSWGLCQGVTTNPTICFKCGVRGGIEGLKERIVAIANLVNPSPVSVEVISEKPEEIIAQAKKYSQWAGNIVTKVTITDRQGESLLPVIYKLTKEGISINVTAMTTFNQAILAARAIKSGLDCALRKPTYSFISIFGGRISDEQGIYQSSRVIKNIRRWLDLNKMEGIELIVGSTRCPEHIEAWARSGPHILTITPEVLSKCLLSARTKETVDQFLNDAQKAMKEIDQ